MATTNTTRQNILDNIKDTINGVRDIKSVEIDRMTPPDMENTAFPAAFIYSDSESRIDNGVIGQETWDWIIAIEVWARNTELEDLLQDIHSEMHDDYDRGGYADYSFRTGVEFFYIDPAKDIKGMVITYLVRYQHTLGTM